MRFLKRKPKPEPKPVFTTAAPKPTDETAYRTQLKIIKNLLLKHGRITRNQAVRMYITRLSAYIYVLRHEHDMEIEGKRLPNKYGKGWDYEYTLKNWE